MGAHYLVGFVREKGAFADRGIPESRIYQSQSLELSNPKSSNPRIKSQELI